MSGKYKIQVKWVGISPTLCFFSARKNLNVVLTLHLQTLQTSMLKSSRSHCLEFLEHLPTVQSSHHTAAPHPKMVVVIFSSWGAVDDITSSVYQAATVVRVRSRLIIHVSISFDGFAHERSGDSHVRCCQVASCHTSTVMSCKDTAELLSHGEVAEVREG